MSTVDAGATQMSERFLLTPDGEVQYAWLLWGRRDGQSKPLGCYGTRELALEAEDLTKAHRNAEKWEDIWVAPWPLSMTPTINFRMAMD